jgi:hypothetical protein|tara:strand:- start:2014 stop:2343 length:330 start_codon:yes stop_codon:yes gene_type:complete
MKKVICEAMKGKEIDIDINFKMWPCCMYQNIFAEFGKTGDPYIDSLPADWNDTRVHGIDKILRHYAYTEHFNDKSWTDEKKCSPVCYEKCAEGGEMHLNHAPLNLDGKD